jgi:ligand-binding SRPBCC domain-containing protein
MIKGPFKSLKHIHSFETIDGKTTMIDQFYFESPLGFLGRLFNVLLLESYLRKLLIKRNDTIKQYAENNLWGKLIRY